MRESTTPPPHMMASRSATRCCVDTQARSRSFREPAVQARRTGTAAPGCRSRRSDQISSPTIQHAECLGGHSNAEPFSGSLAMKGSIPGSVARGSNTWNSDRSSSWICAEVWLVTNSVVDRSPGRTDGPTHQPRRCPDRKPPPWRAKDDRWTAPATLRAGRWSRPSRVYRSKGPRSVPSGQGSAAPNKVISCRPAAYSRVAAWGGHWAGRRPSAWQDARG